MHVSTLFAVALLGWLATRRWRPRWRWPRRLLLGLVVAAAVLIWPFTNNLLAAWLEYEFDPEDPCLTMPPALIVVLPAGLRLQPPGVGPWSRLAPSTAARLLEGVALARRHPGARLVVPGSQREAAAVGQALATLGSIEADRILTDGGSTSTDLAARRVAELAAARGRESTWLVTSALHMPRARAAFRKRGVPVCPYPVDFSAQPGPRPWWVFPPPQALERADRLAYELLGWGWYWLTGKV